MARNRKSDLVWKHNRFFGYARGGQSQMNDIIRSETASPAAKETANEIWSKLQQLSVQLKDRIDANP